MDRIKTVLIANRGEIALRINSTCQSMDLRTIALYTQEDQLLSYVFQADRSYKLPKNGLAGYLDGDSIIEIALQARADAIHPGYGFLSENAQFAQKVIDAGLVWIGPSPQAIESVASKSQAQKVMKKSGIPTIPGFSFDASRSVSFDYAKQAAEQIGYPVILKCADGGGGKAMRSVQTSQQFDSCWRSVVSESQKIFNSHTILVEKLLERARHVEVQVAGDGENFIHLYERECSIQRNHQKVIETAPCLFLKKETKQNLLSTAIACARAIDYDHIGTVEFLVTPDQKFYFLEMNTRLQVEHSVTEFTTGVDLVALQLHLASSNKIPPKKIPQSGYSIECRIYAEDPVNNFIPSTGTITNLVWARDPFLRIDHDLEVGQEITPFFDPMLAKLTTWANTKQLAVARMINALKRTNISGVHTNLNFLKTILSSEEFSHDQIYTNLLHDKNFSQTKTTRTIFDKHDCHELLSHINQKNKIVHPSNPWRNKRWRDQV